MAIGGVVYGHWLLVDITCSGGQLSGRDAVDYVSWGRWVTWAFQVMPVFFLVVGYVNARSWTAHHARGESWTWWVRDRAMRLWWPTAVFVTAAVLAVVAAGWLTALQLWFLPVYLLLIALTPVMLAVPRRRGPGRKPSARSSRPKQPESSWVRWALRVGTFCPVRRTRRRPGLQMGS